MVNYAHTAKGYLAIARIGMLDFAVEDVKPGLLMNLVKNLGITIDALGILFSVLPIGENALAAMSMNGKMNIQG